MAHPKQEITPDLHPEAREAFPPGQRREVSRCRGQEGSEGEEGECESAAVLVVVRMVMMVGERGSLETGCGEDAA